MRIDLFEYKSYLFLAKNVISNGVWSKVLYDFPIIVHCSVIGSRNWQLRCKPIRAQSTDCSGRVGIWGIFIAEPS